MALHADGAADRVAQLTTLTERLTGLMRDDLAALEVHRPSLARAEELGRLANIYRHECARVRRDPSMIAAAPPADRARLKAATEQFEAVLARHLRAVEAARSVSEGLVRAIAEELESSRPVAAGYGPRARRPGSPPLAFNKTGLTASAAHALC
jgi:hypothetical protein